MKRRTLKWIGGIIAAFVTIVIAVSSVPQWMRGRSAEKDTVQTNSLLPSVKLAPGMADALLLPDDVVKRLGIQVITASQHLPPETMRLSGTLMLDASHFTTIRSRFSGVITEIPNRPDTDRPAVAGDTVRQGELLATVWSSELGETKSELVAALSRLRLDNQTLERLKSVASSGAIPGRMVVDTERIVESDRIAVDSATRTLQAWRVPEADIETVRQAATKIEQGEPAKDDDLVEQWSRVELRAPFDGVILERNLAPGAVIGTEDPLIKIGDLSRLRVVAYAYEEDLPQLDQLPEEMRVWEIVVPADPNLPPIAGTFDHIGDIIDPEEHTALVMGWIANPHGMLRVGQFVRVNISLPAPGEELVIPASALVERGLDKIVFVRPDPKRNIYQMKRVTLGRRLTDFVTIPEKGPSTLQPQEEVVTVGAVEMLAALIDLQAARSSLDNNEPTKPNDVALGR